jgi:replicative DNA helicase
MLLGWPPGCLACLGGPTGKGKTALAFNFALKGAQARSHHIMGFILEMDRVAIGHRILAAESMIDGNALRAGRLEADDTAALVMATHRLVELDAYFSVVDEPTMTVSDIKAEAMDYERQRQVALRARASWEASHPDAPAAAGPQVPPPIGLIIVDYLQLVSMPDAETRERAVAQTSKQLCALARLLNCTILALVQLNDLGAIRESKAPEHDSTIVMTLAFEEGQDEALMAACNLTVRKHRHGPVGKVPMVFDRKRQRFGEVARERER